MSSTATRNARSQTLPERNGPSREIDFTLLYGDNGVTCVTLGENQTVNVLQKMIESHFKIPISKQFIYGWPNAEPKDEFVQFKDLKLGSDVVLHVAVNGIWEYDDVLPECDSDGARPGTSRELSLSQKSNSQANREQSEERTVLYPLYVYDVKNGETYNEIPFEGHHSVADVKKQFSELTGIPIKFQEWGGWPECISKNKDNKYLLKDIGLDKPFHSLVLNDLRENAIESSTDPTSEAHETGNTEPCSSSSVCNKKQRKKDETKKDAPSPRKKISSTARKSTSKAALRDFHKNQDDTKIKSGSTDVSIENNQSQESLDSTFPNRSLSRSPIENSLPSTSQLSIFDSENLLEGPSTPKKFKSGEKSPSKSPRKQRGSQLFLTIGENNFQKILKYLDPMTHLSLRRVCKTTKEWVSKKEYTVADEEEWKRFSLTITGNHQKTFETVVHMNLPITRFIFDVKDEGFYEQNDAEIFISFCSLRVRDVTLRKFFMFQNPEERKLFESFQNLESLTIDDLVIPNTSTILPCPRTLANLQILKLNYQIFIHRENSLTRPKCWDMTWSMLSDCVSLLYFRFPRVLEIQVNTTGNNDGIFTPLLDYISNRVRSGGVSLEYLDLKHYSNPDSNYINRYVKLLRKCHGKDIKLKNVHALVIQQVLDEDGVVSDEKFKFCENIVSLINYSQFVENAPLMNLEKITVDVVPSITDYFALGKGYKDIFWPKLRTIKIKDSVKKSKTPELWDAWQQIQEDLYGHHGIYDRGNVNYVQIDSPKLPYFLSEGRLSQRFCNLRRLEIVSWCNLDTERLLNKRLHAIWKKLRLEELRIENCSRLNDYSFIDEDDEESPSPFLRLTPTLKKITLGLDSTGVTDKSLIKVFSRMEFKIFILLSKRPTKISEAGLLKLRSREFGKHIEYFPFNCWSSSSIDPGRFERLGKSFRSLR